MPGCLILLKYSTKSSYESDKMIADIGIGAYQKIGLELFDFTSYFLDRYSTVNIRYLCQLTSRSSLTRTVRNMLNCVLILQPLGNATNQSESSLRCSIDRNELERAFGSRHIRCFR